jgi:arylsulfatase A-like enzyme
VGIVLHLRDPAPGSDGKAGAIVTFNGHKLERLLPGAAWAAHRVEIPADWFHQGVNELVLSGQPGRTAIQWLDLRLPGPQAHVTVGDTTRRALVSSGPLVVDLPDPLPAGARLDVSLARLPCFLPPTGRPVRYRIEWCRLQADHAGNMQPEGEWQVLLEELVRPEEVTEPGTDGQDWWIDRIVPLDLSGGGPVRLRLLAKGREGGESAGIFQVWGPLLLSWPGTEPVGDTVPEAGLNLIVILADTLRADRLGAGGSAERLTPALDALAAESVQFRDTMSQAPSTVPSVSSFFTGRYFNRINRWVNQNSLPPMVPLFAEMLAAEGVQTMAVVANPLIMPETGFARGFDEYYHLPGTARKFYGREDLPVHRPAEAVNARFLERLPSLSRGRFFAYLHYMDPHDPYPVEPGAELRFSGGRLDGLPWEGWLGPAVEEVTGHGSSSIGPLDRRMVARAYDNGVRHLDRQLGLLLAELRRRGLLSRTVVAVVADHGEELFDHGLPGHGHTVYDELLRVPALIRFPRQPGYPRPVVVTRRVELLDVAATLLDVMGAGPAGEYAGRSLLPLLQGNTGTGTDRARYFETRDRHWVKPPLDDFLAGVESDGWKLVHDRRDGVVRLFHLDVDPGETEDLSAIHAEKTSRMSRLLQAWLAGQQPLEPAEEEAASTGRAVAERETEALKALGYMQ